MMIETAQLDRHAAPRIGWRTSLIALICFGAFGCSSPELRQLPALAAAPDFPSHFAEASEPELGQEPSTSNPNGGAAQPSELSDQQQRQLQVFSTALLNPASDFDAATRRSAAQELIAMEIPQATESLAKALSSRNAAIMLAAISAMQSAANPPMALLNPAVEALADSPAEVVESLAWALSRYGDDALRQVVALALDQHASTASRLGPIQALSAFDSQRAASALMSIVNNASESSEVLAAACDGLQRISGLSYGTDLPQWRTWWKEAESLRAGQWSAFITKSLGKRAAQLQQDLQKQRETNDRISKELFATYRDLYPVLPTDEQLRRLPQLLQHPLVPVREFAIARISLLLRDSVRIPLEVQQKLAERVNDEVPALRAQSARLLDELNYEQTGPILANRLSSEQVPLAVSDFLTVLAKRPCREALEPVLHWLHDADMTNRAAAVLWSAFQRSIVSADQRQRILDECRAALEQHHATGVTKLMARIGNDKDTEKLMPLLDGDDADLKAAVADGFSQRGLRQPLIDRAHDPIVFPFAIRVVADGPSDLDSFKLLTTWAPDQASRKLWGDAVLKIIDALPTASLLAADDVLAKLPAPDAMLRTAVLSRAAALPREQLAEEQRSSVIARLAPLLIEQGDPARAFTLLEGSDCASPVLKDLCFQASALTGHYDRAMELQVEPAEWMVLLAKVAVRDLAAAAPLSQEIARRFAGRLNADEQSQLEQIEQTIRDSAAASATTRTQPGFSQPN